MTQINWLVLGILVFVSSVCLSKNTDNDGDNDNGDAEDSVWQYRHHGISMYTMVVSKGCTYLAG